MSLRSSLAAGFIAFAFLLTPAVAEPTTEDSHLAYYTYYKSKNGMAEESLVRMNPQLSDLEGELPAGSLLCVPNDKERELTLVRKKAEPKQEQKAEAKEEAPRKTGKKSKSKKETEEPDDDEDQ